MSDTSHQISREKFLALSIRIGLGLAGMLGLGGLVRFFSHQPESGSPSSFDLGPASEFPSSGRLVRLDIPAVIYQTDQGYLAYSLPAASDQNQTRVLIGAYESRAAAVNLVEQLKKDGFDPKIGLR